MPTVRAWKPADGAWDGAVPGDPEQGHGHVGVGVDGTGLGDRVQRDVISPCHLELQPRDHLSRATVSNAS